MKKQILFICLFLSACLGGYSPSSKFYSLQSQPAVTEYNLKDKSIGIEAVSLPDYLDKGQIVSFSSDGTQMYINEQDRWGGRLDDMIQRTIAENLGKTLPFCVVKSKTALLEKFNYLIKVQIVRFDKVGNNAVLTGWWQITNSNGNVLYKGKTNLQEVTDGTYPSYVKSQSKMLFAMSEQIAKKLALK